MSTSFGNVLPEGLNYLQNLVEVYRVFKRIQQSYSMAVWNPTVQSQCEDAEKAWKGLLVHLKLYIDVIPSRLERLNQFLK